MAKIKKSEQKIVELPNKAIRSGVIKAFLGKDKCFCFSCGNATKALKKVGVKVVGISKQDDLAATKYIDPFVTKQIFDTFDATSGHLPISLMPYIAQQIKNYLPDAMYRDSDLIFCPLGSGETLFALSWLFPISRLVGVYGDYEPVKFAKTPLKNFIANNYFLMDTGKITSIMGMLEKLPMQCWFINTEGKKYGKGN